MQPCGLDTHSRKIYNFQQFHIGWGGAYAQRRQTDRVKRTINRPRQRRAQREGAGEWARSSSSLN